MKLAYSLWKPETGNSEANIPKLLLLHGMGGTGALWRPIAAGLEDRYEVLAPDQRGHGKSLISSVGATYTPQDYGQDIVETLDELDFHPTWIVGHSMGVRSACATAHLKPDWVQGLILVDLGFSGPAGGGLGDGLALFLKMLPHEFESRAQARLFMQANCPDQAIAQYLMAVSVQTPEGAISFPFDHAALIKTIESVRDTSVRDWVQQFGATKTLKKNVPTSKPRQASRSRSSQEQATACLSKNAASSSSGLLLSFRGVSLDKKETKKLT
jgi:pimeloyl-ACP methyl ester carboxylesterase